jgi:hypothetical protein
VILVFHFIRAVLFFQLCEVAGIVLVTGSKDLSFSNALCVLVVFF